MHIPSQQYMRAHLRQAASHCMCHRVVYATLIDKNAELQQSPCPIQPDYCRAAPHKGEIAVRTLIGTPFSTANCKCCWQGGARRSTSNLRELRRFFHLYRRCCGLLWQSTSCTIFRLPDFEQFRESTLALVLVACLASTCVQSTVLNLTARLEGYSPDVRHRNRVS